MSEEDVTETDNDRLTPMPMAPRERHASIFVSTLLAEENQPLLTISTEKSPESQTDAEQDAESAGKSRLKSDSEDLDIPVGTTSDKKPNRVGSGAASGTGQPLEEQLTNEKLRRLEQIFESADEDGGGGLDMEEFRKAMRTQLGAHVTDAELDKIFMKVDTNCDGTVDWDEYLTYMLLECRGQDTMSVQARQPFPRYVNTVRSPHRDSVVRLMYVTSGRSEADHWHSSGRYMSISQEGVACFWSLSFKLLSSHRVEAPGKSVWVTDAVHIPSLHAILIATTSRELIVFDVTGNRFARANMITNMDACALSLDYWSAGSQKLVLADGRKACALLVLGDARGGLGLVFFHSDPYLSPLNSKLDNNKGKTRLAFQELLLNKHPAMSAIYRRGLHQDFVRQVKYCPQLGCTISCCRDTDTAMYVSSVGQKTTDSYFKVTKGVDSFDYCPTLNVIVTGGYDGVVRVWNPYVYKKPVSRLYGHQFPVLHVVMNQTREHIVSINEVKEIRVHDLTTQTCIQTIYKKVILGMGPRHVTAALLNQRRQSLVFATSTLGVLEHCEERGKALELTSHPEPVTVVLYNPLFEQVVSVATDSLVCVWNIAAGEKVMQFKAHQVRRQGRTHDIETTAMNFDPTFRRLITAAKNGVVRIWNFNNGACLRELPRSDQHEVTSVVCAAHYILTAGWNRKISVFIDQVDDESVRFLKDYHRDDILSMAQYNNSILASACHDGNTLVWSLATGRLLFCLNAHKSHKQIRAANYFKSVFMNQSQGEEVPEEGMLQENNPDAENKSGSEKQTIITENVTDQTGDAKCDKPSGEAADTNSGDCAQQGCTPSARFQDGRRTPSIEKLLFLQTRESDAETATLVAACGEGSVQAWSLHHHGGLLGTFPATQHPDTCVLCMETDPENVVLVTGDSHGYVKVFDISNYCVKGAKDRAESEEYREVTEAWHQEFPFVAWSRLYRRHCQPTSWMKSYFENPAHPPILNSFRAHLKTINSIALVPLMGRNLLLTASSDCSVRLWTIRGQFIGIFGQKTIWDSDFLTMHTKRSSEVPSEDTGVYRNRKVLLPSDIRRVGSPTTLAVFNGGRRPAWRLCRNIFKWLFHMHGPRQGLEPLETAELEKKTSILETGDDTTQVMSSSILKGGYKRLTRHHPLPKISQPSYNGTNQVLSVYGCLEFHGLEPISKVSPPESLKQIMKKNLTQQRFMKATHGLQRKVRMLHSMKPMKSASSQGSVRRSSSTLSQHEDQASHSPDPSREISKTDMPRLNRLHSISEK